MFSSLKLERLVTILTIGLIVLVAALNIFITLAMMVMDKNRDIAVLMSMGAKERQVWAVFTLHGVLIGALGTLIGLVLGYGISWVGNAYHLIPLQAAVYSLSSVPFRARPWDIEQAGSVCTLCPSQCNVSFTVRDAEVKRVLARDNADVEDGWLCDRGRYGCGMFAAEERVAEPLQLRLEPLGRLPLGKRKLGMPVQVAPQLEQPAPQRRGEQRGRGGAGLRPPLLLISSRGSAFHAVRRSCRTVRSSTRSTSTVTPIPGTSRGTRTRPCGLIVHSGVTMSRCQYRALGLTSPGKVKFGSDASATL